VIVKDAICFRNTSGRSSPRRRCTRRSRSHARWAGRAAARPQSKPRCGGGGRATFGSGGARKYGCDQTGCGGVSVVEQPASLIGALNYRTTSRPTSDKASKRSLSRDCGRDAHYCAPSAQNRTCSFPAYGSHLGCLTAGLGLPYVLRRRGHAFPALCPARAASVRVLLGLRPSLHRLRCRSPGLVRRLRCYYGGV